jgi:hypothetical protein
VLYITVHPPHSLRSAMVYQSVMIIMINPCILHWTTIATLHCRTQSEAWWTRGPWSPDQDDCGQVSCSSASATRCPSAPARRTGRSRCNAQQGLCLLRARRGLVDTDWGWTNGRRGRRADTCSPTDGARDLTRMHRRGIY